MEGAVGRELSHVYIRPNFRHHDYMKTTEGGALCQIT